MTDSSMPGEKPPRMLIADDDPSILRLLADRCARVGFEVDTATNGVQALIRANRSHPDVMVIDINMPEADGLTVCARLLDPSKRALNVIVVTGSRETEAAERCEGFGAFLVRKGPDFWNGLGSALIELFPRMADRIKELHHQPIRSKMRERPCVLMIDDDPSVKQFLSSRLAKGGVELLFASDIAQGYRMACKETPSAILSDYFLPNGGIPYLLSRLRSTLETENIPVFVLTGRDLDEITQQSLMREFCGKPGVVRIFRKSFDTEELFGALKKVCAFEYDRIDGYSAA
jgi:CheY-like chemotaxis protein